MLGPAVIWCGFSHQGLEGSLWLVCEPLGRRSAAFPSTHMPETRKRGAPLPWGEEETGAVFPNSIPGLLILRGPCLWILLEERAFGSFLIFLIILFVKPVFCHFIFLYLSDVKGKGIWSCWLWHEQWNPLSWERSGLATGWGPLGLADPEYTPGWSQASISQVPINQ